MSNEIQLGRILTSELVYRALNTENEEEKKQYIQEYKRRLGLLGLTPEQINEAFNLDKRIIENSKDKIDREEPWCEKIWFNLKHTTVDTLPNKDDLTLSELVLITDEANFILTYFHDDKSISKKVWTAVYKACNSASIGEAIYAKELERRLVEELGWSEDQSRMFVRNESIILQRYKWRYNKNITPWTKETVVVEL